LPFVKNIIFGTYNIGFDNTIFVLSSTSILLVVLQ
jgi:hypothetical protein